MERANKLRRLEEFRRAKPHCSASALGQILTDIKTWTSRVDRSCVHARGEGPSGEPRDSIRLRIEVHVSC